MKTAERVLCAVCGLAFVVRVAYWILLTPHWTPESDASQYLEVARNVAAGNGYSSVFPQLELHATAFRPPLYPLLLAIPTSMFGPEALWPARLLSIVLGVGVVALTVVFVRRIGGLLAGAVAGIAVAIYPPLVANDTVTLSEPLALALLLGVLITLDQRRPVWCGALVGLLLLTRPNAYLVLLVVVLVLWRSLGWRRSLLSAFATAAVVVPWMIRNEVKVGSPQISTSDGFTMAAVYAPIAQQQGEFVDPVKDGAYDGTDVELDQLGPESEWSSHLRELAMEGARENPGYIVEVVSRNFLGFFELKPSYNSVPESLDGRHMLLRKWALPTFYLMTLGGLCGLWVYRTDRRLWPAMVLGAQFVGLSLVLVAPPRLRAPFDLLMCIGVGLLASHLWLRSAEGSLGSSAEHPTLDHIDAGSEGSRRSAGE